jgi:hypothetical protein
MSDARAASPAKEQMCQIAGKGAKDADTNDDDRTSNDPPGVSHRKSVAVADRGDWDDDIPKDIGCRGDVRIGCVLLQMEYLETAEFEHEDTHQQQSGESAASSIRNQAAGDALDAIPRSRRKTRMRRKIRSTFACGNGRLASRSAQSNFRRK